MKWLGQHIVSLIARFRSSVYFENVENGATDTDKFLVIGSSGKLKYRTGAEVASDIGAGSGDITSVAAGTNLSGGGTTGAVTINLVDATDSGDKGAASFSSNDFSVASGAVSVKEEGIDLTAQVAGVLPSANLDADTAHLTTNQTFTGVKTFSKGIIQDGNQNITPGDGAAIHVDSSDITDNSTAASGTAARYAHVSIEPPRLLAEEVSVTTTDAATLYIAGAPAQGTNQTLTRTNALWVDSGNVKFDGDLTVDGTIGANLTGNVTGNTSGSSGSCTGQAATVATIAGLAPNTATTQATQAAITTCANLTTVGTIGTGVWQGTTIKTAYIGDDQITEDKLANTLLAEIDANTAKSTNVTTNLTATTHASQITINSSDGTNVVVAEASGSIAGVMTVAHHDKLDGIETSATADQTKSDIDGLAITTVGTVDTGVWNGTAVASAYLDADTAHYSATREVTHHTITDDIDSSVVYISLGEIDAENTTASNKALPILAPAAGKLLKIFCRTSVDMSAETFTWKLYTRTASQSTGGNPAEVGAQSGAGPTNKTLVTYDFTSSLDSGTNAIAAGDKVQISIEAGDGATANSNYFITCLWEWDLS